MVSRFDWLEPLVPVSKNWFGRFESLASVLVTKNRIKESEVISGTGTRFKIASSSILIFF